MRRKLGEKRRCHRLKEQALSLQGTLLGVAATAAVGDVATAWKTAAGAVGGLVRSPAAQIWTWDVRPSPDLQIAEN